MPKDNFKGLPKKKEPHLKKAGFQKSEIKRTT